MTTPLEARTTRRGVSDSYMEARNAILARVKTGLGPQFMWLEVVEGKAADSMDYVIHASDDRNRVPPFAIEVYDGGRLDRYEVNREAIREFAIMPEELRKRIVLSQRASNLIDRAVQSRMAASAAP